MNHPCSKNKTITKKEKSQVEIIPAINANNFEEILKKVDVIKRLNSPRLIEAFTAPPYEVKWAQIDVADGTFTKNTIWHNPRDLALLDTPLKIELHLMLDKMERRIEDWLLPNVHRIIFHISATNDADFVIEKCKEAGKEVGIAIGPDESLAQAMKYKDKVDMFQILSVHPGLAGGKLVESSFDRISELRGFCEKCIIEIDGGMNKETAPRAVKAGANLIVAASAIFGAEDIEKAISELKEAVNF